MPGDYGCTEFRSQRLFVLLLKYFAQFNGGTVPQNNPHNALNEGDDSACLSDRLRCNMLTGAVIVLPFTDATQFIEKIHIIDSFFPISPETNTWKEFQYNTEPNEPSLSVKQPPDQRIPRPEKVRAESKDFLNFFFSAPKEASVCLSQLCRRKSVDALPSYKTRSENFIHFHPNI